MSGKSIDEIKRTADELYASGEVEGGLAFMQAEYDAGGSAKDDVEVVWRLGRAMYAKAMEGTDKAQRKELMEKAVELLKPFSLPEKKEGEEGEEKREEKPVNVDAIKWYAAILGVLGDYLPSKEKIGNAFKIRDAFVKAIEMRPDDAHAHFCLGKWCWGVLQIGWLERQAASVLFATPPSSTYEECEQHLLRSHELNPKQPGVLQLLGELNYQQKKWAEAKKWFEEAAAVTPKTEAQKRIVEESAAKAKKC